MGVVKVSLEEGVEVAWRRGRGRGWVMQGVDGEVCTRGGGVSDGNTEGVFVVAESASAAPFEVVRVEVTVNESEVVPGLSVYQLKSIGVGGIRREFCQRRTQRRGQRRF